jgi:crotonobetainyl-CoA:carnitine CoA-transferase CaiB-like acyl-CoA transferase
VVVELGTSVAAPTAAQIFAELGADVFKVENPAHGDDCRSWGPPFVDGVASMFVAINRNKRSVAIDLKDRGQCEALRSFIIARADIVLQNLRAGVVEKFGLDANTLTAAKPELIYCNLSAFGDEGPRAGKPGYDPLMQAFGGLMSVTGEDGRPPVRVAPAIIDQGSAMWMVIGVLTALHRRAATGKGGVISASLYETALFWMGVPTASFLAGKEVPRRLGTENGSLAPYKAYETQDGWVVICAGNDSQFTRLAAALGHPEWSSDPEFRSNPERVKHRERINGLIAVIVKAQTRAHWQEVFDDAGVPCAPMLSLDEVLAHPQSRAVGMLQDAPDGGIPLMGIPLRFDGERPPFRASAPRLGEATDIVLGAVHGKAAE